MAVIASLLIISGGFVIFKNREEQQKSPTQQLLVSEPLIVEEINKNSNNNSLKNWEEGLQLMANTQNPENTEKITNPQSSLHPQSSLTDTLSRNFFNNYLALKQPFDKTLDKESQQKLIDSFLADFENSNTLPSAKYSEKDIKVSPNNNENSIKEYGNNLALVIKKYFDPIPESELAIIQKAMSGEEIDKTELQQLGPIAEAYLNSSKEMLSLVVPLSFSKNHLALINDFNEIGAEIKIIKDNPDDPMRILAAISIYKNAALEAKSILKGINSYFAENNVAFKGEPGDYFKAYLE